MATAYTGNAGGVSLTTPVTETLPSDGDALNVASVNTPLQRLADYDEALRQRATGAARAWAAFSTNGAGGVTIISSYNIASIAISGTQVLVTFSTALPSANYIVIGGIGYGTTGGIFPAVASVGYSQQQTTTQFIYGLLNTTTGNQASPGFNTGTYTYVTVAVFG